MNKGVSLTSDKNALPAKQKLVALKRALIWKKTDQISVAQFLQIRGLDFGQLEVGEKSERRVGADLQVRRRAGEHLVRRHRHLAAREHQMSRPVKNEHKELFNFLIKSYTSTKRGFGFIYVEQALSNFF